MLLRPLQEHLIADGRCRSNFHHRHVCILVLRLIGWRLRALEDEVGRRRTVLCWTRGEVGLSLAAGRLVPGEARLGFHLRRWAGVDVLLLLLVLGEVGSLGVRMDEWGDACEVIEVLSVVLHSGRSHAKCCQVHVDIWSLSEGPFID